VIDYELLLLLDPEASEERQNEIVSRTRELIEKGGGTVERHDPWGRRRLAYEIDHKAEGSYHLLTFAAEAATVDEIGRVLRIDDTVMRHLTTRRSERGPSEPVAVAAPTRDDADEPATAPAEEE
jgi:small subunit ribosomal protein S6